MIRWKAAGASFSAARADGAGAPPVPSNRVPTPRARETANRVKRRYIIASSTGVGVGAAVGRLRAEDNLLKRLSRHGDLERLELQMPLLVQVTCRDTRERRASCTFAGG